ncbi:MAG: FHA domain-containing protein [Bacteroidaceae bacterium]
MKRLRCPKCDEWLAFDETKYSVGQSLVFVCENCGKQFTIKIKNKKKRAGLNQIFASVGSKETVSDDQTPCGFIHTIENVFGFHQELPLFEGENVIGRRCVGTIINVPIETSDMSMDRRHCMINVTRNKQGNPIFTLRDAPSVTGTFVQNDLLEDNDRRRLEEGTVVTIGATTFIVHLNSAKG